MPRYSSNTTKVGAKHQAKQYIGTAKVVFEEERGGATGSNITRSDPDQK